MLFRPEKVRSFDRLFRREQVFRARLWSGMWSGEKGKTGYGGKVRFIVLIQSRGKTVEK